MAKPCYDDLKEQAEDLAFMSEKDLARNTPAVLDAIIRSDISHIQMDQLAHIIAKQIDVAVTSVRFDLFRGRADFERLSAQENVPEPTGILAFLNDQGECLLGDPKTYYTPRPKFYDAYHTWCYRKGVQPFGKHAFYRLLSHPAVTALGVRHGADSGGSAVIRGVLWLDGEL